MKSSSRGVRRGRTRFFALILALWGAVVVARLVQIQIAQGSRYRAKAQRQQERRVEIPGQRGSILDREGRELAVSVEATSVYAIPDDVRAPRETAAALAPLLEMSTAEVLEKLSSDKGFVWMRRQLGPDAAEAVKRLKLSGIHFVDEPKRFYPKGRLASAVLGFVGTDGVGLAGLEHFYDSEIRGKPGELVALTDARRSRYGENDDAGRPAQEGASLVLSLDSGVQFAAEHELAEAMRVHRAKSGCIVVMDPSNGEVLAMASAPDFDPNAFNRYPAETRRNRAIADAYEPGSTFKIVTGALALEQGLVTLDEIIDTGDGTIRVANTTIQEADRHRYGALTLAGVFEHSSNIGIIRVGMRLGAGRLHDGAESLGVGRPTGVDLPGENPGIFRPLPKWSGLSTASISMGQEVSLNALQLARITAVAANGGFLVEPHVVTRIVEPGGRRARAVPAADRVRVLSPRTADAISRILVGVVEHGTGAKAAVPGFAVAGKTGTAQKAGVGGYQPGRHVPNFVGFAPADDPKVVAVVLLEEPQGKYYAAEVAAPLFSRVMSQTLGILRIAPREQQVPESVLAEARPSIESAPRYRPGIEPAAARLYGGGRTAPPEPPGRPAPADPEVTPSVVGMSAREAVAAFAQAGVLARLQGSGFVVAQDPPAGSPLRAGAVQTLFLADSADAPVRDAGHRAEESPPTSSVP